MHVVKTVSRRGDREYVSYLLRTSFREDGKVKKRTLANLSSLPPDAIALLRGHLAGTRYQPVGTDVTVLQSLPHGQVAAVWGQIRRLGLDRLLGPQDAPERRLVLGMLILRLLQPVSKLATSRLWTQSTLGTLVGVPAVTVEELYAALDWLQARQGTIEKALTKRHLANGSLVLYDVTSVYLEGDRCPLAARGYSRDHRPDRPQLVVGLLLDGEGRPVAVEVFKGNTADPSTVNAQIDTLRQRFKLTRVVLVGDRGMLTEARLTDLRARWTQLDWVTCLRAPAIQALRKEECLQRSLFDERSCVELETTAYPGERLIACRNPLLAAERTRKRGELLERTEAELAKIAASVAAGRLQDAGAIGVRVGKVMNRWKMAKHFTLEIGADSLTYARNEAAIAAEQELDGIYVVRTSVPAEQLPPAEVVLTYKQLSRAEQMFQVLKRMDLQVRPVFHHKEERVRAHVFLCMLAGYVQWHLERAWAPLLYREEEAQPRLDPVAPPDRSPAVRRKEATHQTATGLPVQSFRTLLKELATVTRTQLEVGPAEEKTRFWRISLPNAVQERAFALIEVDPNEM